MSRVTNSFDSLVGVSSHACPRAARAVVASASLCCSAVSSSALSGAAVGAHAVVTPMHDARNSVVSTGLLPVQKSTSYNWEGSSQGVPKVEVSGLAENLRPASEVELGSKFSAGRPRHGGRLLSSHPRRATRTRFQAVLVVER